MGYLYLFYYILNFEKNLIELEINFFELHNYGHNARD